METEGNGFLPVQALNELRRKGLEKLKEAVLDGYRREDGLGAAGYAEDRNSLGAAG